MNTSMRHDRYFESGRKFYHGILPVLNLQGSFFQMGRQYGALMREELQKVYRFACAKEVNLNYLDRLGSTPSSVCGLRKYDEFFRGMSETSFLTVEELLKINAVEVIYLDQVSNGLGKIFDASRCSSFSVNGSLTEKGRTLAGRNYDWLPEFEEIADTLVLTVLHPADGSHAVAAFNWTGCMYMTTGMNSNGVYLNLNSGMFADPCVKRERIHNVWMLFEMLFNCSDMESLKRCFNTARAAASYLIMACTPEEMECFHWHTQGTWHAAERSRNGELIAVTNHFATPDWKNDPMAECETIASSVQRRENLLALAQKYETIDIVQMMEILSVPFEQGGAKVKGTLFQVIADPAKQDWYVHTCLMDDWVQIPLTNILRGNGDLA